MQVVLDTLVAVIAVHKDEPPELRCFPSASPSASDVNTLPNPAPVVILIAGVVTVPVNVGEARGGALSPNCVWIALVTPFT